MMRSLYSGVSGLRNHQTRMDVIGNNIANVNTTGFKASRTVFQDIFSQTVRAASAGTETQGGMNPSQIGLGVRLGAIDVLFTPGAMQRTDNMNDICLQGDGFFVINTNGGGGVTYGVVHADNDSGTFDPALKYARAGNFYIDNQGFLVTSDGYFVMGYEMDIAVGTPPDPDEYFPIWTGTDANSDDCPIAADLVKINLSAYTNITINDAGMIEGIHPVTELRVPIAQLALGMFTNNGGLQKEGGSLYSQTSGSGPVTFTIADERGAGQMKAGGLEMSNVDLAAEFTDMIVTQRGFQANSRIITVSDTMLEELINLKR